MSTYYAIRKADGSYVIVKGPDNVITHTRGRLSRLWDISNAIDEFGRKKNEPNKALEPTPMRVTDSAAQTPRHA